MAKIVIIGGGESGIGAARLGKSVGHDVFVTDSGRIAPKYKTILEQIDCKYEEEGHDLRSILSADIIVKSPGVPNHIELIQSIISKGIPLISELQWAYDHRPAKAKIIAITGSNGKTTTTHLVHHLLRAGGIDAVKGGNLGVCFSNLILDSPAAYYVLEVSSFQLDNITSFQADIACLLNITPDHLDRYANNFYQYARAKIRIAENLSKGNHFVYNADDKTIQSLLTEIPEAVEKHAVNIPFGQWVNDAQNRNLSLRGPHNAANLAIAHQVANIVGVSAQQQLERIPDFVNSPHRLQVVTSIDEVLWINDSKATNVDAVYYALQAFDQPIVWIAGGQDKGNDYSVLLPLVRAHVKYIIALTDHPEPLEQAFGDIDIPFFKTQSVSQAVQHAAEVALPGDVVLLSPACASFDLFDNYEQRGKQYMQEIWDMLRD